MTSDDTFPAQALFEPQSIAVVGVPRTPKAGQFFLQGLRTPGFHGRLYAVNPNADEVLGVPCYHSVADLPETPDLAIFVLPTLPAIDAIGQCADRGVKAAALFTAGFSETGTDEGRRREAELLAAARRGARPVRLLGPNCMALYVPKSGIGMLPNMPSESGPVAFVAQSGSLCNFVVGVGAARGLTFSKVISIGNQADLNAADFFEYLADDPETEVIASYIEGAKDGPRLRRALERAAAKKRVVVWKSGRTQAGAKAAHSHTGALAGEFSVWSAMLRQVGALLAHDMDELLDLTMACSFVPKNGGRRVAILAGPGGPAVAASDACEENGLELATLSAGTQEVLRGIIPIAGTSVRNPIDMGLVMLSAAEMYYRATEAAAMDPNVDAILAIGGAMQAASFDAFAAAMADIARQTGKVVLQSGIGGGVAPDPSLARHGVAAFSSPERALRAYALVTSHAS